MDRCTKLAVAAILVVATTIVGLVEARLPDKTVISGPECIGNSVDKDYNTNVRQIMDFFVDETKNAFRKSTADEYVMRHSYPNRDCAGSVTGEARCNNQLEKLDCWSCLVHVKDVINKHCHHPVGATVQLRDCSMTFKNLL